ncbi:MAG TPA: DUF72 domain-containing protein [Gaiellaceae bacterium]|nr:DUF72 domain-containing protein [Gaiellaceae bacterium]
MSCRTDLQIRIGTSGWSYPTWRPGFYPQNLQPSGFLEFYARHFDTVELNTTAYRLPSTEQFERWAGTVPDGFRFTPKLALARPERAGVYFERIAGLGDRLGPVRVVVQSARDDDVLAAVLEVAAGRELAFDFRHDSWADVGGVVKVNDFDAEPFRYIRLREPPYTDADLAELAVQLRAPAYVYLRHEDEPTAPAYADTLRKLLSDVPPPG